MNMKTRQCQECNIVKSLDDFYLCNGAANHRWKCKKCENLISKKYRADNPGKMKALKSKKINAICCYGTSELCEMSYIINEYEYNKNIKRNDEKYRCLYCGITDTHLDTFDKHQKNIHFFDRIDSELQAYLLGVIAGDGSIEQNQICVVAHKKDRETLRLFKTHISPSAKIGLHHTSKNCRTILLCSQTLSNVVQEQLCLGMPGKKSNKIRLPNLSDRLLWHFIRGLMDTDGWVGDISKTKGRRLCFYSSTSTIIFDDMKKFLTKYGIKCKIHGIKLNFSGDNAELFLLLMYENSTYKLSRKYKRFLGWPSK